MQNLIPEKTDIVGRRIFYGMTIFIVVWMVATGSLMALAITALAKYVFWG
jgi:hypothetical protein